jgi:multicomponent Na+:H+ antiporter subunit G
MIYVAIALMLVGSTLSLLAAVGILRFPDLYTRLHAASKAGALGAGLILLSVAFASDDWTIAIRCVVGFAFVIVTSPIAAHLLARAALRTGTIPDHHTSIDEYDPKH